MKKIVALLVLCILMAGCKHTEYITVPEYRTEWLHDSVDRWHTRTEYRDGDTVYRTDTFYLERWHTKMKHDSVGVPYPVHDTVRVVMPLTWWQRTQQGGFWWMLAVLVLEAVALFFVIKRCITKAEN